MKEYECLATELYAYLQANNPNVNVVMHMAGASVINGAVIEIMPQLTSISDLGLAFRMVAETVLKH
eukprot:8342393-Alexandrium_andersonii.AAC.1